MTQRQEFKVLRTYEGFEVREYKPCVIAEVKVSAALFINDVIDTALAIGALLGIGFMGRGV